MQRMWFEIAHQLQKSALVRLRQFAKHLVSRGF